MQHSQLTDTFEETLSSFFKVGRHAQGMVKVHIDSDDPTNE